MKIARYDRIDTPRRIWHMAIGLQAKVLPILAEAYGFDMVSRTASGVNSALLRQMRYVMSVLPPGTNKRHNYQRVTVLDLGCGHHMDGYGVRYFGSGELDRSEEPWLCRAVHHLGAAPIGVDIGCLKGEKFRHYMADLTEKDSLDFIADHSVDVANASALFTHINDISLMDPEPARRMVIGQLERILKPGGIFIYDQ